MKLPDTISRLVAGKPYTTDSTGMSEATVMLYDDCVLKIMKRRETNDETVRVMRWLYGRIPVPEILAWEKDDEYQYLLMSRAKGRMSCDRYYLEHPEELLALLAEGLKLLWSVDVSTCPRSRDINVELAEARYRVEHDLVNIGNAEPGTFGEGGFKNPWELLSWLEANRPVYEPVLSHGDFCLPNIFIEDGHVSAFIDLGDTGTGDRWRDIALCYRSLKHNFDGTYGGRVYPGFNPDRLFDKLGIEPDREKLRYYILLDELF